MVTQADVLANGCIPLVAEGPVWVETRRSLSFGALVQNTPCWFSDAAVRLGIAREATGQPFAARFGRVVRTGLHHSKHGLKAVCKDYSRGVECSRRELRYTAEVSTCSSSITRTPAT